MIYIGAGMKYLIVVLAISVFSLAACANPSAPSSNNPLADAPLATVPPEYVGKTIPSKSDTAAGAVIFQTDCVTCHGDKGLGDGPASQALNPRPANLVEIGQKAGDDFLYWRISTGVIGTAMPAWKGVLSDPQIWDVVAFIRTLK